MYRREIPKFDVHLCVHERIQSELASWGVKSHVVWPCPREVHEQQEIQGITVGSYQPTPFANDIYYFQETCEIAKRMPNLPFLFYGCKEYPDLPENVTHAGRLTPEECKNLYDKFSCILRLTRHDGMPVGLAEAKMKGLHLIENFPYAGALYAESVAAVMFYLNDPRTHQIDKSHWPDFYRHYCSPGYFRQQVMKVIHSAK